MPDSYTARDKRSAFYLEHQEAFLERLKAELHLLKADALLHKLTPAARLNGSSDIAWERRHPELFNAVEGLQLYDYSKIFPRVLHSLGARQCSKPWPKNYHLTYSAGANDALAKRVLEAGGSVAVVFATEAPSKWLQAPVINGDSHDARFMDAPGSVVSLKAKGVALVDVTGFTRRPCPDCGPEQELALLSAHRGDDRVRTTHKCPECRLELDADIPDPYRFHEVARTDLGFSL